MILPLYLLSPLFGSLSPVLPHKLLHLAWISWSITSTVSLACSILSSLIHLQYNLPLLCSCLQNTARENLCKTCRLYIYEFQSQMRLCSAVLSLIYPQALLFPNPHSIHNKFSLLSCPLAYLHQFHAQKVNVYHIAIKVLRYDFFHPYPNVPNSHLYTTPNFLRYSIGVYSFPELIPQPAVLFFFFFFSMLCFIISRNAKMQLKCKKRFVQCMEKGL